MKRIKIIDCAREFLDKDETASAYIEESHWTGGFNPDRLLQSLFVWARKHGYVLMENEWSGLPNDSGVKDFEIKYIKEDGSFNFEADFEWDYDSFFWAAYKVTEKRFG